MDPNLFAIDWAQLSEGLIGIIVLAFFVERALALFIENGFIETALKGKPLKGEKFILDKFRMTPVPTELK